MKATVKGLVQEANAKVKVHEVKEAIKMLNNTNVQFVDVQSPIAIKTPHICVS
jgi:hypothetical protein